jgi:hypothetical protein
MHGINMKVTKTDVQFLLSLPADWYMAKYARIYVLSVLIGMQEGV